MNSKVGIFSVLFVTMMMLLIPATLMANAQQYDPYEDDEYYYEEYYPPTHKDKREPPMLLVKKDVLYCDVIANGTDLSSGCSITDESTLVGCIGQPSFDSFKANEIKLNVTNLEIARLCGSFSKEKYYRMENFGENC